MTDNPNSSIYALTGDIPALGDYICRPLRIPNEPKYIAAVNGLISLLAREEFWEQFGDLTPENASQLGKDIFTYYLENECNMTSPVSNPAHELLFTWQPFGNNINSVTFNVSGYDAYHVWGNITGLNTSLLMTINNHNQYNQHGSLGTYKGTWIPYVLVCSVTTGDLPNDMLINIFDGSRTNAPHHGIVSRFTTFTGLSSALHSQSAHTTGYNDEITSLEFFGLGGATFNMSTIIKVYGVA